MSLRDWNSLPFKQSSKGLSLDIQASSSSKWEMTSVVYVDFRRTLPWRPLHTLTALSNITFYYLIEAYSSGLISSSTSISFPAMGSTNTKSALTFVECVSYFIFISLTRPATSIGPSKALGLVMSSNDVTL